jgi:hypothetical protein
MVAKLAAMAAGVVLIAGLAGQPGATASGALSAGPVATRRATAAPVKCSPDTGRKLVSYGGPVYQSDFVDIVYWGSWWQRHGTAAKTELRKLFTGLGSANGWAQTLAQYCFPGEKVGYAPMAGVGSVTIDRNNPPRAPTDRQLALESAKGFYCCNDVEGLIAVVTPPGTAPKSDTAGHACGHHTWAYIPGPEPGVKFPQPWIDIPYGVILKSHGCGWKLRQGVAGALSVVAGHEWAESVTDPYVNSTKKSGLGTAWATRGMKNNEEVADLCEPELLYHIFHTRVFVLKLKTGRFVMQDLWSNAARKCMASN